MAIVALIVMTFVFSPTTSGMTGPIGLVAGPAVLGQATFGAAVLLSDGRPSGVP